MASALLGHQARWKSGVGKQVATEGDMAQPSESGWAQRVMREAGVQTWVQYPDKVRTGRSWEGCVKL